MTTGLPFADRGETFEHRKLLVELPVFRIQMEAQKIELLRNLVRHESRRQPQPIQTPIDDVPP